jgi:alkanesulfonate monooxygenase SsuD/methylene tetrahydromethanopterin reductase-like flavin-dependent oxidoreductase (luciferase family)
MRRIWSDDPASFAGEHVSFDGIRVHPKPERPAGVPVYFGGNGDRALERVAAHGDGWYGFYLDGVAAVRDRVELLMKMCAEHSRCRCRPWPCRSLAVSHPTCRSWLRSASTSS